MTEKTIAVVGAGLIGSGWSIVFARAGYDVNVYDPEPKVRENYPAWLAQTLSDMNRCGLVSDVERLASRIRVFDDLEQAVRGAVHVQESVYETVQAKTAISEELDRLIDKETVVGSSSSGIPSSAFTANCRNKARFLINHPVNPPHLVPLVELVPAPWTDPSAVTMTKVLMNTVGQTPILVAKEVDGFILNRLQGALLNEAWALYEEGYASIDDIDKAVRDGLGLRWSFMGPFETIDLNAPGGIADYAQRLSPLYFQMGNSRLDHPWPDQIVQKAESERRVDLQQEHLADRRAWRDEMLMKLMQFKHEHGLAKNDDVI